MSIPQPQFNSFVPEKYDRYLVPVLFQPYADSMARRIAQLMPSSVLELACGTGVVTRSLVTSLPVWARIVATDISPAMLEYAERNHGDLGSIEWQVADACTLPFADASFDAIVCQFGAMFFPDKAVAMAEAYRVLKPGGHLLFSTWGALLTNPLFHSVEGALSAMFPEEETPFMPTPFSMNDPDQLRALVQSAGFDVVEVAEEAHSVGPHDPAGIAAGFAFGTPLSVYLSGQGYDLHAIHATLTSSMTQALGNPVQCEMHALVIHANKPTTEE